MIQIKDESYSQTQLYIASHLIFPCISTVGNCLKFEIKEISSHRKSSSEKILI